MYEICACTFVLEKFHSWKHRCDLPRISHQDHNERRPESHNYLFFSAFLLTTFVKDARNRKRQWQCPIFCWEFLCFLCSFSSIDVSWQVNRTEGMTSAIPSMLTTACWILRPTNAGKSLLLIHSETTGTTSTSVGTKLLPQWSIMWELEIHSILPVIMFISLKLRFLKQSPDAIPMSEKWSHHCIIL